MAQTPPRYVVVPFIGPDGAGKTTLLRALGGYLQRRDGLAAPPLREVQASGSPATVLDARIARGFLQHVDFPSAEAEDALLGATPFQGAVLVVSATDGVLPGTLRSLTHAREVGIPRVVVALTKCDLVEDPELLDLVTMEIREQLRKREYGGDAAPVVPVSGLPPERGGERALAGLAGLLDAVDRWIP
jgi:elongation factor Tu